MILKEIEKGKAPFQEASFINEQHEGKEDAQS
jgi:hypothetical protein